MNAYVIYLFYICDAGAYCMVQGDKFTAFSKVSMGLAGLCEN